MSTAVIAEESYVTVAEADAFFRNKPEYASWETLSSGVRQAELAEASRRIDAGFVWNGEAVSATQLLRWPRIHVTDSEGNPLSASGIPRQVKIACLEQAAYQISPAVRSVQKLAGNGIRSASAGGISVALTGSTSVPELTPRAAKILRGLGHPCSSTPSGLLFRG